MSPTEVAPKVFAEVFAEVVADLRVVFECMRCIACHTSPSLRCAERTQKGGGRRGNRRFPYKIDLLFIPRGGRQLYTTDITNTTDLLLSRALCSLLSLSKMSFYHLTATNEVCVELHAVYNEISLVADALKLISAKQDSPVSFNPGYYQACDSLLDVLDSLTTRAKHLNMRNFSESLEEPCEVDYNAIPDDPEVNELPPCFGQDVYDQLYFQCPQDPVFPREQLNPAARPYVPHVKPSSSWQSASDIPDTVPKTDLHKLSTQVKQPLAFKSFITTEDLERSHARYDMLYPMQQTEYALECYAPNVYHNENL